MMSKADKFPNCREWRSFLSSADLPGPYPSFVAAVKAGHAWLSGGAATGYSRLLANGNLVAGARKTLGI